jgi:hypothetical protein
MFDEEIYLQFKRQIAIALDHTLKVCIKASEAFICTFAEFSAFTTFFSLASDG